MTLHTMTSFAPSLPSLPSYPRHLAPSRSASPAPFPQSKKSRPSFASASFQPGSQRECSYAHPLTPSATDSDNDDDGLMTHSIYSDREYRSSLVSNSRKRGFANDSDDELHHHLHHQHRAPADQERAGKRRIIDVVGVTLGGVLRGAWEIFRPRIPFYSSTSTSTSSSTSSTGSAGTGSSSMPEPVREEEMSSFATQRRRATSESWDSPSLAPRQWRGAASPSPTRGRAAPTSVANPYAAPPYGPTPNYYCPPPSTTATEAGMSARWVMVSPTEPATATAAATRRRAPSLSSPTARRPRLVVASKKRGLKPPPRTPPCQGQQSASFGFGTPTSSGKRHRKGPSRDRIGDDELEMDDDMRRFNERLKAMIREGKEALGATVEVVYDDDDDDVGMGDF